MKTEGDDNNPVTEAARTLGRLGGKSRSPRKIEAVTKNLAGVKGGRPARPLSDYPCSCGADSHRWDCPRGQAIKRAEKRGKPLPE